MFELIFFRGLATFQILEISHLLHIRTKIQYFLKHISFEQIFEFLKRTNCTRNGTG